MIEKLGYNRLMNRWALLISGYPCAFGPYTDDQEAGTDAETLRNNFNHDVTVLRLEKIDWSKIKRQQSRREQAEVTEQILLDIFPTVGTSHPSSYVQDILRETPGTLVGARLNALRARLGIRANPVRKKGLSGVHHWEWIRVTLPQNSNSKTQEQQEQQEQKNQIDTDQSKTYEEDLVYLSDLRVWVEESREQEYRDNPTAYRGYIEDEYGNEITSQ